MHKKCEVIFLIERATRLRKNIIENDFKNPNILFKSDMKDTDTLKSGRPFDGKCWIMTKELAILNVEFYYDVSIINLKRKSGANLKLGSLIRKLP